MLRIMEFESKKFLDSPNAEFCNKSIFESVIQRFDPSNFPLKGKKKFSNVGCLSNSFLYKIFSLSASLLMIFDKKPCTLLIKIPRLSLVFRAIYFFQQALFR